MPRRSQGDNQQMAFQLKEYQQPSSSGLFGSEHFISLKNQRDHTVLEACGDRSIHQEFLEKYADSQEEEMIFITSK